MFGFGKKKKEMDLNDAGWERELIHKLSLASLIEQRRTRRWGIFFKLLIFVYLFALFYLGVSGQQLGSKSARSTSHTAMIEVNGLIAESTQANAENIIDGVRRAFANEATKGIILRINSPGGSPVQSDYIYREIRRLAEEHEDIPLHAVIADVGASGAYYIASAAQNIYVNPSSIVGSIGVMMNGFGFVDALDKLGVERRLMIAGDNKGILDPFLPMSEVQQVHMQGVLDGIHEEFIASVKAGRGERLKDDPLIFSGLFWGGRESIALGLADEIGDVDYVAREVIGEEKVVDFTPKPDFLKRFADRLGASVAGVVIEQLGLRQGLSW